MFATSLFRLTCGLPTPDAQTVTQATTRDTSPGVLIGTAAYMSPEQLVGEDVSAGWDLWALSVVAYEMLTGSLPFSPNIRDDWLCNVLTSNFTPVRQHLPEAPVRWQEFFACAFAVKKADRPSSARIFFEELQRALS